MKKLQLTKLRITCIMLGLFITTMLSALAQLSPSAAGYIDAVGEFGVDNSGNTVTTTSLQNAINAARDQKKALFLRAGTYLVNNTLRCENKGETREDPFVIVGPTQSPASRAVILLKSGSFTNAGDPKPVVYNVGHNGDPQYTVDGNFKYPDNFNRIIKGIDIRIESNNAGAIGLDWRGAEGCGIYNVNIDVTGGFAGMRQLPGSGGATQDVTIKGGRYGIDIRDGATQPTPTLTYVRFEGQTDAAIIANAVRGALTMTGCSFKLAPGVPVYSGESQYSFTFHLGGVPLFTDCIIEYTASNTTPVINFTNATYNQSISFINVYVKNASKVIDGAVNANGSGWHHFKEMQYSGGDTHHGVKRGVYVNGSSSGGLNKDEQSGTAPPSDLISRHGWGTSFPCFQTPGVVNVNDYSGQVSNGDWGPAIQAAINAAGNNGVVFIPAGTYVMHSGITLLKNTKIIGVSHIHTVLRGLDMQGRRFDGSTNAFTDAKPMITTQNDPTASPILADMWVSAAGPYNLEGHNPEPCRHYAVLWQAGKNSIISGVNLEPHKDEYFRPSNVLEGELTKASWLNLRSIASPTTIGNIKFESDCAVKYHIQPTVNSRILVETVEGNKRLLTRSIPEHNAVATAFDKSNLTISKNGSSFTLNSIKVANGAWNPVAQSNIVIQGFNGNTKVQEITVAIEGINSPREQLISRSLNWSNITKVIILSDNQFSVDDVVIDGATTNFESVTGDLIKVGTDFQYSVYYDGYRDLPLSYATQSFIRITGGVKFYNHWKHGDTWMPPTSGYVEVINNHSPVSFYHFHCQHSMNDSKMILKNAKNVSVYGVKTENNLYFSRAFDSWNIRFIGHGGLTSPPAQASHYRFDNCQDFYMIAPTDELKTDAQCQYCGGGNAILPRSAYGDYEAIKDYNGTTLSSPGADARPILWKRGQPVDPWGNPSSPWDCSVTKNLTVVNGSGGGIICVGELVAISANIPECKNFAGWTGATQYVDDPADPNTTLTMPNANITVEATFTNKTMYTLTVNSGSGDGSYCEGTVVDIAANTPPSGQIFDKWTGNVATVADIYDSTTTIVMNGNKTVTASYKNQQTGDGYQYLKFEVLTVNSDVLNLNKIEWVDAGGIVATETIGWNEVPYEKITNLGSGVTAEPTAITLYTVWDETRTPNDFNCYGSNDGITWTLIHSETNVTNYPQNGSITFTFDGTNPVTYTLTVNNGTGDGTYDTGSIVDISANNPPSGQIFDAWTGDVSTVADISDPSTTIEMNGNKTVTATYKTQPVDDGYQYLKFEVLTVNSDVLNLNKIEWLDADGIVATETIGWNSVPYEKVTNLGAGVKADPSAIKLYTVWDETRTPNDFNCYGSNDGTTWTLIHSETNVTNYPSNGNITFTFDGTGPEQYTLTTLVNGDGTINVNPQKSVYDAGETVTLTAVAATGSQFDNWSGDASGSSTSVNILMDGNKIVTANFSLIPVGYRYLTFEVISVNGDVLSINSIEWKENSTLLATNIPAWTTAFPASFDNDLGAGNLAIPTSVVITPKWDVTRTPKDFNCYGSEDGINQVLLHSETNVSGYASNTPMEFVFGAKNGSASLYNSIANQVQMYPNPVVNNFLTLQNLSEKHHSVSITDLSGKVVYYRNLSRETKLLVPCQDFAKGVYIISISGENGMTNKQLIIK